MSATPPARTVRGSGPGLLLAHGVDGGARDDWGPLLPELRDAAMEFASTPERTDRRGTPRRTTAFTRPCASENSPA